MLEITQDVKDAIERMEKMDPEELDAFRSDDSGQEFGASHLDTIRELMRRADGEVEGENSPRPSLSANLLAEVIKAEKGEDLTDSECYDQEYEEEPVETDAEFRARLPKGVQAIPVTPAVEPPPAVLMVTKLIVTPVVGLFKNGRMVREWAADPMTVLAHETDDDLWREGVDGLVGATLTACSKQLTG